MSTTEQLEAAILNEARAGMGLSEGQREERFVALRAGLAAGALPSTEGDLVMNSSDFDGIFRSSAVGTGFDSSAKEWLWGVSPLKLLAGGLVLGGALGFFLGHNFAPPASVSDPGSPDVQSPNSAEVQEVSQLQKEDDRLGTPLSEIPLDEEPSNAPTEVHSKPHKSATTATPLPEKAAQPSFHEELSFLRRAQAALRSGQPALALGLMQSLDEIQKVGALGLERRVTKTLALCALDRSAEAKAMAAPLFQSQPDSVYARRLSESCAGSPDALEDSEKK
jgi:hypothetical protein